MLKRLLPALLLILLMQTAIYPQTVTGSWFGYADIVLSGEHNNYLAELIIQQKGDEVTGILGYYFKNGYQSIYIHGNYEKKTRTITIDNIPITYFRAKDIDGVNCYMDFTGVLMVSKVKSSIYGYFATTAKYRYTCPELQIQFNFGSKDDDNADALPKYAVTRKFWQPLPQDVIVMNGQPVPQVADSSVNENGVAIKKADIKKTPTQKQDPSVATGPPKQTTIEFTNSLVKKFESRKNIYADDILVSSDSIRVSFYDNGEIDGDTISVFLNNKPIMIQQELAATAINLYIHLDKTKSVNELGMFAENLGKYPPNTALMVVYDGNTRQEVHLSSSLTQNAIIRIRQKKK